MAGDDRVAVDQIRQYQPAIAIFNTGGRFSRLLYRSHVHAE
jgi:hypothetical protein